LFCDLKNLKEHCTKSTAGSADTPQDNKNPNQRVQQPAGRQEISMGIGNSWHLYLMKTTVQTKWKAVTWK